MRILSGIQPSGSLHIGNYFAMMYPMIEYQQQYDLFCCIVNYHALTTVVNPSKLQQATINACLDFLALGLNPDKTVFYVQSDIPEVCELAWILNNFTTVGLLERAHSFKDKLIKGYASHNGLFSYPVLMAADILLYQAHIVPIGKDQKQHLEITRDIAIKFNFTYGETFTIPTPHINKQTAIIPGIDGQKMSKSYNNTLEIFAEEKQLRKCIMKIITNSIPIDAPKDPSKCNVYTLISLFMNKSEREDLAKRYWAGGVKYSRIKIELFERMWSYFKPYREKRIELAQDLGYVRTIMKQGAKKARTIAKKTLSIIRQRIGLNY